MYIHADAQLLNCSTSGLFINILGKLIDKGHQSETFKQPLSSTRVFSLIGILRSSEFPVLNKLYIKYYVIERN